MSNAFIVDVAGVFPPGCVEVRWREEPPKTNPLLQTLIADTWAELTRSRPRLFNGQLARYLGHRLVDGRLTVEVGPTDYAHFVATNLFNWGRGDELGWELFSNPVGTSALPQTQDGWLLLGRRNEHVAFHGGHVHSFGGGLEAGERQPDGTIDAFGSISRELREELHIHLHDLERITCLGLIRDRYIRQPELVFDAELKLTRAELEAQFEHDDPDQEHVEWLACRHEPEAIVAFIQAHDPITPVAVGALCLHGRAHFGDHWYRESLRRLAVQGPR